MAQKDALWRANSRSFVGVAMHEEGAENVVYNPPEGGEVAENLSPMNDVAQAIVDGQKSAHPNKSTPKAGKKAAKASVDGGAGDDSVAGTAGTDTVSGAAGDDEGIA